jgi:hypothetical protein
VIRRLLSPTKSTSTLRAERGQGLVEFALILPLLLVLMLGIIDFGRLFFIYSEVSNAVREAIRFSAVNPYDCNLIRNRAGSTLTLTDLDSIDFTVSFDDGQEIKWTYPSDCSDGPPEGLVTSGDRITIRAQTQAHLLTAELIGPIVRQTFGAMPIEYVSSRTILPAEGIETGPTSTPLPTRTPPPGSSPTPTSTPSPTATNTPQAPFPPPNFKASVNCNNKHVDFSWDAVPGATAYVIYNADTNTVITSASSTNCNNCNSLGTSQSRVYYVVALNAGGQSGPSNLSAAVCGAGATDTPTPTTTPTPTPTNTPTHTPTQTPSQTPTPSLTPSPSPTLTGNETATPTPTATSLPALQISFEPNYPARKATGPNKQFWVRVRVLNSVAYPVMDATVTIVEPASYAGAVLTHLGEGVYGLNGKCFSGSTNNNTYIRVRAERFSYGSAEVGDWTDNNPASTSCPLAN